MKNDQIIFSTPHRDTGQIKCPLLRSRKFIYLTPENLIITITIVSSSKSRRAYINMQTDKYIAKKKKTVKSLGSSTTWVSAYVRCREMWNWLISTHQTVEHITLLKYPKRRFNQQFQGSHTRFDLIIQKLIINWSEMLIQRKRNAKERK